MNSCRSTLIVDVYDVVPWQSPGGTTFHDVNGAKLSWLAVCILHSLCSLRDRLDSGAARRQHSAMGEARTAFGSQWCHALRG